MEDWNFPITKEKWAVIARSLTSSIARASGMTRDDSREYAEFGMVLAARRYDPARSSTPGAHIRAKGLLLAMDELRKNTRSRYYRGMEKTADFSDKQGFLTPTTLPPSGLTEQGEVEAIIREHLSGEFLIVMLFHYFGGHDFRTIGNWLGMSGENVFYIHSQALNLVRYELGRYLLGMNHDRRRSESQSVRTLWHVHQSNKEGVKRMGARG